jgi:hypothetical protein
MTVPPAPTLPSPRYFVIDDERVVWGANLHVEDAVLCKEIVLRRRWSQTPRVYPMPADTKSIEILCYAASHTDVFLKAARQFHARAPTNEDRRKARVFGLPKLEAVANAEIDERGRQVLHNAGILSGPVPPETEESDVTPVTADLPSPTKIAPLPVEPGEAEILPEIEVTEDPLPENWEDDTTGISEVDDRPAPPQPPAAADKDGDPEGGPPAA